MAGANDTVRLVAGPRRAPPHRRLLAWAITGPPGFLAAGLADWAELYLRYLWARARGHRPWE
jgi:hypothetical protein